MIFIRTHRNDDLIIRLSQNVDAVPVKFPVLVYGAHGDIDSLVGSLFKSVGNRPYRRTDKMIFVRKGLRTRLKIPGRIHNRIRIIVILHDIQDSLYRIPFFLQPSDLLIDFGHGEKHF